MTKDAIEEVLADDVSANLNKVLSGAPSTITDDMLDMVIATLRRDRVLFVQKENKGKDDGETATALPAPDQIEV